MELKIEYLAIGKIKPYDKNARKHEKYDVEQIAKSIEKYGFNDPIGVWSKKNIIVEGHGRYEAAKLLGMESVPVVRLDNLTDEQRKEYGIMHNKTAELSTWDFDKLSEELEDLDFGDFDIDFNLPTKITDDMLEEFFETASQPAEATTIEVTTKETTTAEAGAKKLYTIKCPHCEKLITLTEDFEYVKE